MLLCESDKVVIDVAGMLHIMRHLAAFRSFSYASTQAFYFSSQSFSFHKKLAALLGFFVYWLGPFLRVADLIESVIHSPVRRKP